MPCQNSGYLIESEFENMRRYPIGDKVIYLYIILQSRQSLTDI